MSAVKYQNLLSKNNFFLPHLFYFDDVVKKYKYQIMTRFMLISRFVKKNDLKVFNNTKYVCKREQVHVMMTK